MRQPVLVRGIVLAAAVGASSCYGAGAADESPTVAGLGDGGIGDDAGTDGPGVAPVSAADGGDRPEGDVPPDGPESPEPDAPEPEDSVDPPVEPPVEPVDPGVLLRRLGRDAYNRTVHDLLGTSLRPADDFPADVVSDGFDHLSDHQAVSPLLVSAWSKAAEALAEEALSVTPGGPLSWTVEVESLDVPESFPSPGFGDALYTSTPAVAAFELPAEDVYEVTVHAFGSCAGSCAVAMEVDADGVEISNGLVSTDPAAPTDAVAEVVLGAGVHEIAVLLANPTPLDPDLPPEEQPWSSAKMLHVDHVTVTATGQDVPPVDHAKALVTCDPDAIGAADCAASILGPLARRAWRRPVSEEELAPLVALVTAAVDDGRGFPRGIRVALEAILLSPHFLFLVEGAGAAPEDLALGGPLNGHEVAARLSYFLWGSMPDPLLDAAADAGELGTSGEIAAQAERMLDDPRSEGLVANLASQWLLGRHLEAASPSKAAFPDWDEPLRFAMAEEAKLFLRSFLEDDRPLAELVASADVFVDERLAAHYGLEPVGPGFVHVLEHETERGGLLAQGGLLTALSQSTRTSPTRRGRWVAESLLCLPVQSPPAGVAEKALEGTEGLSAKEILALHVTEPSCSFCHDTLDPLGFGLEGFDAIGAWRTEEKGLPIDATGKLPNGAGFATAREMAEAVAADPRFVPCVTETLVTWALARVPSPLDEATVLELAEAATAGTLGFRGLLVGIATSEAFRTRHPAAPDPEDEPEDGPEQEDVPP